MSRYAATTDVSPEKSRHEIEKILARYGADQFMYGWREGGAVVAFRAMQRHIRFVLPIPEVKEFKSYKIKGRHYPVIRTDVQAKAAQEQAIRQRWRALALCIKAKLEVVESGITTFEDEFMAQIILPNGQSMSEHAKPLIARAYETGNMPPLLPHLPE